MAEPFDLHFRTPLGNALMRAAELALFKPSPAAVFDGALVAST
ncbi:hypothetical protein PC116_g33585 [Phytophthora cactorum]|nr:hypothetical protein PC116_g33585 [Phytophthora cactorum]